LGKTARFSNFKGRRCAAILVRILIPQSISHENPRESTPRLRRIFVRKSRKPDFVAYPTPLSGFPGLAAGAESVAN